MWDNNVVYNSSGDGVNTPVLLNYVFVWVPSNVLPYWIWLNLVSDNFNYPLCRIISGSATVISY